MDAFSEPVLTDENRARRVRRFSSWVSIGLMIFCNAVFLLGLWASGVNLDELVKTPDVFNPKQDICLRLTWQRVTESSDPVRLCSEWINLADSSGKPHQLLPDSKIRQGSDGHYYIDRDIQADYRLLVLVLFVATLIVFGVVTKWYLVSRYRMHLEAGGGHRASLAH
ncbi:MAG TPA: hypothetical protein VIU63_10100 [Nitrospira sp.]